MRWENSFATDPADEYSEFNVSAKDLTVTINDYTQADTFRLEVDYRNFPFDPRMIRSVAVTIYMDDLGGIFNPDNSLRTVKPIISGESRNVMFIGFADEGRISFDDQKRTVRLEGRDYTSLLIDRKYTKGALNLEAPIDKVLEEVLSGLTETNAIKLDNRVLDDNGNIKTDLPILSSYWGEKDALSGRRNSKKDETYWDVIQDVVRRAALIAYVELDRLVLTKPRNIYDKSRAKRFVYGRNLSSLEFNRKIGRRRGFNIIVRSLNLNTKEVLEAKIPLEATEEWSERTGISNTEVKIKKVSANGTATPEEKEESAPYLSFLLENINSKDQLIEAGQGTYEEIGRQEIEGSFETSEMATADAQNKEFNLLHLRNGTPIEIFIEQSDLKQLSLFYESQKTKQMKTRDQIAAGVAKYLIDRGWPQVAATKFAAAYGIYGNIFYTKSVEFTLSAANGFKCKVDFINFIEQKKVKTNA